MPPEMRSAQFTVSWYHVRRSALALRQEEVMVRSHQSTGRDPQESLWFLCLRFRPEFAWGDRLFFRNWSESRSGPWTASSPDNSRSVKEKAAFVRRSVC